MIELRQSHWVVGFCFALLLYGVTVFAILWREPPPAAATDLGIGGIEIGLGPAGGVTGAAETVEEIEAEVVADTPPEPVPEPIPEPLIEPEVIAEVEPEVEPEPPIEDVTPIFEEVATTPPPTPVQPQIASVAGFSGQSGSLDEDAWGDGDSSPGGGAVGISPDYTLQLQTWLERHKEYPNRARRRRQEGVAMLYLLMDRQGQVLEFRVEQSSGYGLLDEEVIAMVERAQPLPALPESMPQATLEIMVPVEFELRRR
ncbi:MAG: energy transducer TonB [Pseudomonadota bacterium]